jgi:ribose 5-phosphate isomerase A
LKSRKLQAPKPCSNMLCMQTADTAKLLAARKALEFIEDGMVVGLGSGSTATQFIRLLGERVKLGLNVRGIASSKASQELAASLTIPIVDFSTCPEIDITVDGADEITPQLALIKGGGGALLREKIVASASRRFVIVADCSKAVAHLGEFPLPVEVIPMAAPIVARKLSAFGIHPRIRRIPIGSEFITDEGNIILDCECGTIEDPYKLAASIRQVVGVVEHGLFLDMADTALVANDSNVTVMTRYK